MANLSSVPVWDSNLEREINRKTLETLEWISQYSGKIDRSSYDLALKVIDMTTRGLVENDISNSIESDISRELKPSKTFIFTKDDKTAVIKYRPLSSEIYISYERTKKCSEFETNQEAELYLKKIVKSLNKKGYKRLSWG